jgi:hypothetical protein
MHDRIIRLISTIEVNRTRDTRNAFKVSLHAVPFNCQRILPIGIATACGSRESTTAHQALRSLGSGESLDQLYSKYLGIDERAGSELRN